MAWSGITNNQMVTYTDAQTSGLPLMASQSHVSSNKCMIKSEILLKYDIKTNLLSGFTNNQLVPKVNWNEILLNWPTSLTAGYYATLGTNPEPSIGGFSSVYSPVVYFGGGNAWGSLANKLTSPLFGNYEIVYFTCQNETWAGPGLINQYFTLILKGTLVPPTTWTTITIVTNGVTVTLNRTSATVSSLNLTNGMQTNSDYVIWRWTTVYSYPFTNNSVSTVSVA